MSDQQKHNQGSQKQEDWKKNPNQEGGQHQGGQKNPQWDRDKMDKDQQKKSA